MLRRDDAASHGAYPQDGQLRREGNHGAARGAPKSDAASATTATSTGAAVKVLPVLHRGVVLLHEDGKTFEIAPLQVFRVNGGGTVLRIGRNAFHFTVDGRLDSNECRIAPMGPDAPEAQALAKAYSEQDRNRNLAPDEAFFKPGTPGYLAETRVWPPKN